MTSDERTSVTGRWGVPPNIENVVNSAIVGEIDVLLEIGNMLWKADDVLAETRDSSARGLTAFEHAHVDLHM